MTKACFSTLSERNEEGSGLKGRKHENMKWPCSLRNRTIYRLRLTSQTFWRHTCSAIEYHWRRLRGEGSVSSAYFLSRTGNASTVESARGAEHCSAISLSVFARSTSYLLHRQLTDHLYGMFVLDILRALWTPADGPQASTEFLNFSILSRRSRARVVGVRTTLFPQTAVLRCPAKRRAPR